MSNFSGMSKAVFYVAIFLVCSPIFAQESDQLSRELLVDAVRAFQESENVTDPVERADLLEDAVLALDKIEANYAATEIGITILTGGVINRFDPNAVRMAFEEAVSAARLARCETEVSTACAFEQFVSALAEQENMGEDAVRRDLGPSWQIRNSIATSGSPSDEDVEAIGQLGPRDVGDIYRILWDSGWSVEMLDLHGRMPNDHEMRREFPLVDDMVAALPEFVSGRNAVQEPASRRSLQRLIDAGLEGLEPMILAKGSPKQVEALVRDQEDLEASVSRWLNRDWLRPDSDGMAYVALAADALGHSDYAIQLATGSSVSSDSFAATFARGASEDALATYAMQVMEAAEGLESPLKAAGAVFWIAMSRLSSGNALDLAGAAEEAGLQLPANWYLAYEAGLAIAKRGEDAVRSRASGLGPDLLDQDSREGWGLGLAIGDLLAEQPSGDLLGEIMSRANDAKRLEYMRLVAEELVSRARLEDGISGANAYGIFEMAAGSSAMAGEQAAIAASFGNLEWLERGIRSGLIDGFGIDRSINGLLVYITAARDHGYDLSGLRAGLSRIYDALGDDYALAARLSEDVATPDRFGYSGAPDIVYFAALESDAPGAATAWSAVHDGLLRQVD